MDIQLEKIKIIRALVDVDEAWLIRSIQRLLEIEEVVSEGDLQPMSKEELLQRAQQAEADIEAGRVEDFEAYLQKIVE